MLAPTNDSHRRLLSLPRVVLRGSLHQTHTYTSGAIRRKCGFMATFRPLCCPFRTSQHARIGNNRDRAIVRNIRSNLLAVGIKIVLEIPSLASAARREHPDLQSYAQTHPQSRDCMSVMDDPAAVPAGVICC
jgi:hypothetical protein